MKIKKINPSGFKKIQPTMHILGLLLRRAYIFCDDIHLIGCIKIETIQFSHLFCVGIYISWLMKQYDQTGRVLPCEFLQSSRTNICQRLPSDRFDVMPFGCSRRMRMERAGNMCHLYQFGNRN